jgi:hypothetical protein
MSDFDLYCMPVLLLGVPLALAWGYALLRTLSACLAASSRTQSSRRQGIRALFFLGLLLLSGFLGLALGPPWFQSSFPRTRLRQIETRVLDQGEFVYAAVVLFSALATLALAAGLIRRQTTPSSRRRMTRCLLLAASVLVSAGAGECVAVACLWASSVPMPWLPIQFADRADDRVIDVLVIGESSAQGVPYDRWFSVADIVAWKLRAAIPQKRFQIENQAMPGLSLQAMHTKLAHITRRPELAILYAGHNEFQSRYDWGHAARHYADETPPAPETLATVIRRISPLCRLMEAVARRMRIATPPPHAVTRRLVDVPVYTPEEYAGRLREFRIRLGTIVSYLEWIGAQVVLVIPPGNDAGFEPNRSFLPANTGRADREAFASDFLAARRDEGRDPATAADLYRHLIDRQPRFAESHFRLARLLEQRGHWDEAFEHYVAARDLDGLPMRLPSDFHQIYRDVAAQHPRAILIDGPAVLHAQTAHGQIDDVFFADGLHPSLNGYAALAQAILIELHKHKTFGWPADSSPPTVTPRDCAKHYQMDAAKWRTICGYSAWFYRRTAFVRHDPIERLRKAARYEAAAQKLEAGAPLEAISIPGVGASGPAHLN